MKNEIIIKRLRLIGNLLEQANKHYEEKNLGLAGANLLNANGNLWDTIHILEKELKENLEVQDDS